MHRQGNASYNLSFLKSLFFKQLPILVIISFGLHFSCKDNASNIEGTNQTQDLKTTRSGIETVPDHMIATSSPQRRALNSDRKEDQQEEDQQENESKSSKDKKSVKNSQADIDHDANALAIPVPPKSNTNLPKNRPAITSPDWSDILLKAGVGAIAGTAAGSLLDSAISDPNSTSGNNTAAIVGGLSGAVIGGMMANNSQTNGSSNQNSQNTP